MMNFKGYKNPQQDLLSEGKNSRRPHVVKFYGMLKDPCEARQTLRRKNSWAFLVTFLPASLLGVSAGICQTLWWINQK
jgi:hypothetical protein